MKNIIIALLLLLTTASQAQHLRIKKGNVYDSKLEKLDVRQVRFLLADQPDLLKKYNAYYDKSIWGGLLLGAGAGLLVTDLALALTTTRPFPTAATYLGGALTVASIPIMIGRRKKLETVVEQYNRSKSTVNTGFKIEEINIVANQNGAGVQLSF